MPQGNTLSRNQGFWINGKTKSECMKENPEQQLLLTLITHSAFHWTVIMPVVLPLTNTSHLSLVTKSPVFCFGTINFQIEKIFNVYVHINSKSATKVKFFSLLCDLFFKFIWFQNTSYIHITHMDLDLKNKANISLFRNW